MTDVDIRDMTHVDIRDMTFLITAGTHLDHDSCHVACLMSCLMSHVSRLMSCVLCHVSCHVSCLVSRVYWSKPASRHGHMCLSVIYVYLSYMSTSHMSLSSKGRVCLLNSLFKFV
jgi:hypothetical protein